MVAFDGAALPAPPFVLPAPPAPPSKLVTPPAVVPDALAPGPVDPAAPPPAPVFPTLLLEPLPPLYATALNVQDAAWPPVPPVLPLLPTPPPPTATTKLLPKTVFPPLPVEAAPVVAPFPAAPMVYGIDCKGVTVKTLRA